MKFKEDRPFPTPEAAERKLLELANVMEADHAGRLAVEIINRQFREAGGRRGG
jgi:Tfp pilus assembly protein PilW